MRASHSKSAVGSKRLVQQHERERNPITEVVPSSSQRGPMATTPLSDTSTTLHEFKNSEDFIDFPPEHEAKCLDLSKNTLELQPLPLHGAFLKHGGQTNAAKEFKTGLSQPVQLGLVLHKTRVDQINRGAVPSHLGGRRLDRSALDPKLHAIQPHQQTDDQDDPQGPYRRPFVDTGRILSLGRFPLCLFLLGFSCGENRFLVTVTMIAGHLVPNKPQRHREGEMDRCIRIDTQMERKTERDREAFLINTTHNNANHNDDLSILSI